MKAPGTAYDDTVLGKDPQPAHMSDYVTRPTTTAACTSTPGSRTTPSTSLAVALGGHAWEKAGLIWYTTLCDPRLSSNAQFQDFANLTVDNAGRLFGDVEQHATINAWDQVGIVVTATQPKISGNWVLHYSWGPTQAYAQVGLSFNGNGTFTGGLTGKWQQQDGTVLLSFDGGPAKYAGTIDGNIGSGSMTTFSGLDGCWYLSKQGMVGLTLASTGDAPATIDAAGTPQPESPAIRRRVSELAGVAG